MRSEKVLSGKNCGKIKSSIRNSSFPIGNTMGIKDPLIIPAFQELIEFHSRKGLKKASLKDLPAIQIFHSRFLKVNVLGKNENDFLNLGKNKVSVWLRSQNNITGSSLLSG